jgi:hypothetical protein
MLFRRTTNYMAGIAFGVALLLAAPMALRAEMAAMLPIGSLATSGTIAIGNVPAPTGTAIFSGDHLSAQDSAALIRFGSGSSVVLNQGAAAMISRRQTALLVKAEKGIIGFHFIPREEARIEAGRYIFTASANDKAKVGELAIGPDGAIALSLSSGSFSTRDTKYGKSFDVYADSQAGPGSLPTGKGTLVNDTNTLIDTTKSWPENSLRNKCIVARGEAHRIVANKATTLTLVGTWLLFSGAYEYKITDCTEQALADSGAAIGVEEAIKAPVTSIPPVSPPSTGMSGGTKAAIAIGVSGGAAAGIAYAVTRESKSP